MWVRGAAKVAAAFGSGLTFLTVAGPLAASETNLEQTSPLVWVMLGISIAGAIITYAFLAYAIARFRDPLTRRRRYG